MNDSPFDDSGQQVPSVDFDYDLIEEVAPSEAIEEKREMVLAFLQKQREQAFSEGESAAEEAVVDKIFNGRFSIGAILTRVAALGLKHKKLTIAKAQSLTGGRARGIYSVRAKI